MTDREKLIDFIGKKQYFGIDCQDVAFGKEVTNRDLADYLIENGVVIQKHGRWLNWRGDPIKPGDSWCSFRCEECKNVIVFDESVSTDDFPSNFCPNCGAKMD